MRLFEADCPRQLMTEMGLLAQRRRREDKKADQVGKTLFGFSDCCTDDMGLEIRDKIR